VSGTVLLLPLLNDYLSHYLDIVGSRDGSVQKPGSPPVSSATSRLVSGVCVCLGWHLKDPLSLSLSFSLVPVYRSSV
jgi:hypothetical protein